MDILLVSPHQTLEAQIKHEFARIQVQAILHHISSASELVDAVNRCNPDMVWFEESAGLVHWEKIYQTLQRQKNSPPLVILDANFDQEKAFNAILQGAFDYLSSADIRLLAHLTLRLDRFLDRDRLLKINELLTDISTSLINIEHRQIDSAIYQALSQIGGFLNLDRIFIASLSPDYQIIEINWEWRRSGLPSFQPILEGIHLSEYPWFVEKMINLEPVCIPDTKVFPQGARSNDKKRLEYPDQSILSLPLFLEKRLFGFIGFSSDTQNHIWTHPYILSLKLLANSITSVINHHETETALRQSEERWQFALEGSGDGVWDRNITTGQVYYSKRWKEMLGYAEDEIDDSLQAWESLIHPLDRKKILDMVDDYLEGRRPDYKSEIRLRTRDGSYKWILTRGKIVTRQPDGTPGRFVGTHTDITPIKKLETDLRRSHWLLEKRVEDRTHELLEINSQLKNEINERERTEKALRLSEERYRAVINDQTDLICRWKPDQTITFVNNAYCRYYGKKEEDLVGKSFFPFIQPDDLAVLLNYNNNLDQVTRCNFFTRHTIDAGEPPRWQVWIDRSILDDQNNLIEYQSVGRDITEQKLAEERLRQSEERFRLLAENASDIIYLFELVPQIQYTYVSPSVTRMLGYLPEDFYNDSDLILQIAHPEDLYVINDLLSGIIPNNQPLNIRMYARDGSLHWIEEVNVALKDSGDNLVAIQGTARDITAKVQVEQALRESEALYRTTIEALNTPIHVIDANNCIRLHNQEMLVGYQQLGITPPKIGDDFYKTFPFLSEEARQDYREIKVHHQPITREEHLSINGETVINNTIKLPVVENGRLINIVTIIFNITEQRKNLQKIKESQAYLSAIINSAMDAIISVDRQMDVVIFNPAAEKMFQCPAGEALGKSIFNFIPELLKEMQETSIPEFNEPLPSTDDPGAIIGPVLGLTSSGEEFPMEVSFSKTEAANQTFYSVILRDITEREKNRQELQRDHELLAHRVAERTIELRLANEELKRALRIKDEFLATMSHELRSPLNAILGASESLGEGTGETLVGQQQEKVANISESAKHLLILINDILDISKFEAGMFTLQIGLVSIREVAEASIRLVREQAAKKALSVEMNIDPSVGLILADSRRLKQILVNLLSNAVKFTPCNGQIGLKITGNRKKQQVQFTIWDTGIGISPKHMDELFHPFIQLDSRLSRQYPGTGLGLALVRRMVEMHGGSVSLKSRPGKGSRFTVILPWFEKIPESRVDHCFEGTIPPAAVFETQPLPKKKTEPAGLALVAENSDIAGNMLRSHLETEGYRVILVKTGREAVELASQEIPSIILIDIQIRELDGFETIRQIRALNQYHSTPVFALTALDVPGIRENCLLAGADEYLVKPVSRRRLNSILHKHAQKSSLEPSI